MIIILFFLIFIFSFFISTNKKSINYFLIFRIFLTEFFLAYAFIKIEFLSKILLKIVDIFNVLKEATNEGTRFVFGYLSGTNLPFNALNEQNLFIFAFQTIPVIIVIGALSNALFHMNILQKLIKLFAIIFEKTFGINKVMAAIAGMKIFTGHTDCPVVLSNFLNAMSNSNLCFLCVSGFTVASPGILLLYASIIHTNDAMFHMIIATILGIFSSLLLTLIVFPESAKNINKNSGNEKNNLKKNEQNHKQNEIKNDDQNSIFQIKSKYNNVLDAIADGAYISSKVCMKIIIISLTSVSLIHIINVLLANFCNFFFFIFNDLMNFQGIFNFLQNVTFEKILSIFLYPIIYLFDLRPENTAIISQLIGLKLVTNEIVAYLKYASYGDLLTGHKDYLVSIYTIFGFANLSSFLIVSETLKKLLIEKKFIILSKCLYKCMLISILASLLSGSIVCVLFSL